MSRRAVIDGERSGCVVAGQRTFLGVFADRKAGTKPFAT